MSNKGNDDKKSFVDLGTEIGELVQKKNKAYGDSFNRSGNVLREMYPQGIAPDQYDEMLAIVRVLDKLFRIAHDKDAFDEEPWKDIAGYGILGWAVQHVKSGGEIY